MINASNLVCPLLASLQLQLVRSISDSVPNLFNLLSLFLSVMNNVYATQVVPKHIKHVIFLAKLRVI